MLRTSLGPVKNLNDIPDEFNKGKTAIIYGGLFVVDTFLWFSGFLMAFLLAQQLNTPKGIKGKDWGYLYFHRLYRILPVYMFVLFICWALTKYIGNGPLRYQAERINTDCHDWWWTNMLFINNFYQAIGAVSV